MKTEEELAEAFQTVLEGTNANREERRDAKIWFTRSLRGWVYRIMPRGQKSFAVAVNRNTYQKLCSRKDLTQEQIKTYLNTLLCKEAAITPGGKAEDANSYAAAAAIGYRSMQLKRKRSIYVWPAEFEGNECRIKRASPADIYCQAEAIIAAACFAAAEHADTDAEETKPAGVWKHRADLAKLTEQLPEIFYTAPGKEKNTALVLIRKAFPDLREKTPAALLQLYEKEGNELAGQLAVRMIAYSCGKTGHLPGMTREEKNSLKSLICEYLHAASAYTITKNETGGEVLENNSITIMRTVTALTRVLESIDPEQKHSGIYQL